MPPSLSPHTDMHFHILHFVFNKYCKLQQRVTHFCIGVCMCVCESVCLMSGGSTKCVNKFCEYTPKCKCIDVITCAHVKVQNKCKLSKQKC